MRNSNIRDRIEAEFVKSGKYAKLPTEDLAVWLFLLLFLVFLQPSFNRCEADLAKSVRDGNRNRIIEVICRDVIIFIE